MKMKGRRVQLEHLFDKAPPNTFRVTRQSVFGNPFKLIEHGGAYTREESLKNYRELLVYRIGHNPRYLKRLAEKNLACFCPLDQACHVDILLEFLERYELIYGPKIDSNAVHVNSLGSD